MIGVSLATLQNWTQGRRQPALLRVVQLQPDAVLKALAAELLFIRAILKIIGDQNGTIEAEFV